jgi:transposase InsO family protein
VAPRIEVFYNQQRLHSSLDFTSPAEHERAAIGTEVWMTEET